jgi:hypothetical protein
MGENGKQPEATSALTGDELLKVLIDKVVDNGAKIGKVKEQIQKLQDTPKEETTPDQRITGLEEILKTIKDDVAEVKIKLGDPATLWASMTSLHIDLERYAKVFENPQLKEVHHKHFLGKPLMTVLALSAIIVIQFAWLNQLWIGKKQYAGNDIKWRAANQSMDTTVTNALNKIQQDYTVDPDEYRKAVSTEEERRAELDRRESQQWENQQKIQELKDAKKR